MEIAQSSIPGCLLEMWMPVRDPENIGDSGGILVSLAGEKRAGEEVRGVCIPECNVLVCDPALEQLEYFAIWG
jgi:hypothetical protein